MLYGKLNYNNWIKGVILKNKRLAVILSIFAFLTLLVILTSTVFTVQKLELNFTTNTIVLNIGDKEDIISSAGFKKGESVFLINKIKYQQKLEKNNPYLKVVKLETVFPNKLIIAVAEREELFAVQTDNQISSSNSYVLLDSQLKVLKKITTKPISKTSPIVVEVVGQKYTDENFIVGEFASELTISRLLQQYADAFESFSYTNLESRSFAKNILINLNNQGVVTINTDWGLKINIEKPFDNFAEKLRTGVSTFNYYHNESVNTGTITVFKNANSGKIESGYNMV